MRYFLGFMLCLSLLPGCKTTGKHVKSLNYSGFLEQQQFTGNPVCSTPTVENSADSISSLNKTSDASRPKEKLSRSTFVFKQIRKEFSPLKKKILGIKSFPFQTLMPIHDKKLTLRGPSAIIQSDKNNVQFPPFRKFILLFIAIGCFAISYLLILIWAEQVLWSMGLLGLSFMVLSGIFFILWIIFLFIKPKEE
jgi:hypothetical protein